MTCLRRLEASCAAADAALRVCAAEMELAPDPALMHTIFTKAAGRDGGKGEAEHDLSPAQIRQYKEQ